MNSFYQQGKEDLTNESFSLLGQDLAIAQQAIREKNAQALHDELVLIHLFIYKDMDDEEEAAFQKSLDELGLIIYSERYRNPREASRIFDKLMPMMKKCMGIMHDKGILFGMKTDNNTIVAGGGR